MNYRKISMDSTKIEIEMIHGITAVLILPITWIAVCDTMILPALAGHIKSVQWNTVRQQWLVFERITPCSDVSLNELIALGINELPLSLQKKFINDDEDPEACIELAKILIEV